MTTPANSRSGLVGSTVAIDGYSNEKFLVNKEMRGGMGVVFQLIPVRPIMNVCASKTFQASVDPTTFTKECEMWLLLSNRPHIARAHWYGFWRSKPVILEE